MNVIVRDAAGNIASAVTTSGIAWKYPGRLGDSPYISAGNYADNRYGAGACMGLGELTMRHGTVVRAIMAMQMGQSLDQAGKHAILDMYDAQKRLGGATVWHNSVSDPWVRMLLIDAQGNCGAYSTARKKLTYKVQRTNETNPAEHVAWSVYDN
jgi:beta-aspartyl-peptidase (threonine type)